MHLQWRRASEKALDTPSAPNKRRFEDAALPELGLLYRVAKRLATNASDAEDLVGQTLLSAAKGWSTFDGRYIRGWLVAILKNEHLKMLRTRASRPQTVGLEDGAAISKGSLADEIDQVAFVDEILRELDNLPEEFRMAVALCDIEQFSYEEAAKTLSIPVGTVRSRLFRGRRLLREKLKHWPGEQQPQEMAIR